MVKPGGSRPLDRWEEDVPTTEEDVEALWRLREERHKAFGPGLSEELLRFLSPPDWLPRPPRRTFEGCDEPFEL